MKILNFNFGKMGTFEWVVFLMTALGFMVFGRWLYHKVFPEHVMTVEVDV